MKEEDIVETVNLKEKLIKENRYLLRSFAIIANEHDQLSRANKMHKKQHQELIGLCIQNGIDFSAICKYIK
jgi:hypothetical protein